MILDYVILNHTIEEEKNSLLKKPGKTGLNNKQKKQLSIIIASLLQRIRRNTFIFSVVQTFLYTKRLLQYYLFEPVSSQVSGREFYHKRHLLQDMDSLQ